MKPPARLTETFGEPLLRERIAKTARRYNGIACDPATDITVCCGATEAMLSTLKALINPGDEVIVFEPFYENDGPDAIHRARQALAQADGRH
jgi:aminotransferase